MPTISNPRQVTREIRNVRQARLYKPDPVPADVLDELLEIARWTGSSRNTQPWEFIVITDCELLLGRRCALSDRHRARQRKPALRGVR
jgi:nitroreductase